MGDAEDARAALQLSPDPLGQERGAEPEALEPVLGPHGLEDPHAVVSVDPAQAVGRHVAGGADDGEVELRPQHRCRRVLATAVEEGERHQRERARERRDEDAHVERRELLDPLEVVAEPEEVATAALWLCSQKASFVTGQTLFVDGGFMKPVGKGADAKIKAQQRGGNNKKQPKSAKAARKQEMMSAIRVYTAPSGREVYCGRNSRGNEAVSLHFGQDQDVWFHVRGAPGAHVILRLQPGETPSDEDMQFAANIASFHSKVRTGGKVNVSYTSPKYVQKPKGARLGMVTIDEISSEVVE